MLDIEPGHGKVLWVPGRQACAHTNRGSGDQAIGLAESDSPPRMISAPTPRHLRLRASHRCEAHALQETQDDTLLVTEHPAHDLLDIDRTDPRWSSGVTQGSHSISGGTTAQHVDQHGRVEQQAQASADAAEVVVPLRPYPCSGIGVPLMLSLRKRPKARFDVVPATLIVECLANRRRDESAASPAPYATVELTHQIVIQRYVQTHGHSLAHSSTPVASNYGGVIDPYRAPRRAVSPGQDARQLVLAACLIMRSY